MDRKFQVLLFIFIFTLLVKSVKAQEFGDFFSPQYLWTQVLGLPAEWVQPQQFLFNFVIPFIALYTIILGLLRNLRIFPMATYTNWVIAFAMAFMTLPSRIFVTIVGIVLGFAGIFGFFIFIVMFFVGSYLYARGFIYRQSAEVQMYKAQQDLMKHYRIDETNLGYKLNRLYGDLDRLRNRVNDPNYDAKRQHILDEIDRVKEQLGRLRESIRETRHY